MVAQYQTFVDGVRRRAGLEEAADARRASVEVVEAVAHHLDGVDRAQLATALPGALRESVHWDAENRPGERQSDLVAELARKTDVPGEKARLLIQAVLSELDAEDQALADMLRHRLPEEFAGAFSPPGGEAQSGAGPSPRPLDSGELDRALDQLEGWSGTTERIRREIYLPRDRWRPLLHQVKRAESELSHHVSIEEREESLVFVLRTRSVAAVTELDLALARQIDDAVAAISSGG